MKLWQYALTLRVDKCLIKFFERRWGGGRAAGREIEIIIDFTLMWQLSYRVRRAHSELNQIYVEYRSIQSISGIVATAPKVIYSLFSYVTVLGESSTDTIRRTGFINLIVILRLLQ